MGFCATGRCACRWAHLATSALGNRKATSAPAALSASAPGTCRCRSARISSCCFATPPAVLTVVALEASPLQPRRRSKQRWSEQAVLEKQRSVMQRIAVAPVHSTLGPSPVDPRCMTHSFAEACCRATGHASRPPPAECRPAVTGRREDRQLIQLDSTLRQPHA